MQIEDKCCDYKLGDEKVVSTRRDKIPLNWQKSIDNIIKQEGYITSDVYKREISTDGGNYLGLLYEIDVKGKTSDGEKETNIFIKNIINSDNLKIFSVADAYLKESYAYEELSKIFTDLQDEAKLPLEDRFKMAKSYGESNSEAIMLENLAKKGFTTLNRMDVIPLKFAELSVQQLARFHGLSYVLQQRRPEYFNKKLKVMKQPYYFNEDWKSFVKNLCEMSCKSLENVSKKKAEAFIPMYLEKFPRYANEETLVGSCMCHGDYRANNILMKETNGEITEVIPVDFQLLYYGCPLNDFMYFIFSATDHKFRREHLSNLKNMYYDTLSRFLNSFDLDINSIYPRKEFEKQYKERLDYGLMIAMFLTPFCFADENDVPDFGKDEMSTLHFNLDVRFEERIQGIVNDFIEWGYL